MLPYKSSLNTCYSNVDSPWPVNHLLSPASLDSKSLLADNQPLLSLLTAFYGPTFDPFSPLPHALYCCGDFRRPLLMTIFQELRVSDQSQTGSWQQSNSANQWVKVTLWSLTHGNGGGTIHGSRAVAAGSQRGRQSCCEDQVQGQSEPARNVLHFRHLSKLCRSEIRRLPPMTSDSTNPFLGGK